MPDDFEGRSDEWRRDSSVPVTPRFVRTAIVQLWLRGAATPVKAVRVTVDPERRHLSDPFAGYPEVIVDAGVIYLRSKSGSYREATLWRTEKP